MSKGIKQIASIALPVIGTIVAPGIGTAIGGALSGGALTGAAATALGGAALGGAGGAIGGGGLKGAAIGAGLGGTAGFISGSGGFANAAQNLGLGTTGAIGPTATGAALPKASGLAGLISGTGASMASTGLGNLGSIATLANAASGISGARSAEKAAQIQTGAVDRAITAQTESEQRARQTLQPFVDTGTKTLPAYQSLVSDPTAQAAYIQQNPFYKSLADDAEKRLLANQAARGKVGSGETAKSLQNQLTLLGTQLVQNQIGNLQNQVSIGQNAAAGVGSNIMNTGNNIANLTTQAGNAQAAGKIGAANAYTDATQNTLASLIEMQKLNNPSVPMIYR